VCGAATIAEGIAVKEPGRITREIVAGRVREILLVDEAEIEEALLLLLEIEKTVVEGAGAAGLAALLAHGARFRGRKVGVVLSGGNIDLIVLSSIIQRGLVRSGRLARIRLEVPDVPGPWRRWRGAGEAEANIVEIHHEQGLHGLSLRPWRSSACSIHRGLDHVRRSSAASRRPGTGAAAGRGAGSAWAGVNEVGLNRAPAGIAVDPGDLFRLNGVTGQGPPGEQ
jgi:threonine dehydratase